MIDTYGRQISYLRISLTDLCNMRCRYCMPNGICQKPHSDILTFEEIAEIAEAAVSLGVTKIRVTGGEPLVRRGCVSLCRMLGQIDGLKELAMTTNGSLLPRYAQELKEAGVDRVNISLDTLDAEKYHYITGGGNLDEALAGIEAAFAAGLTPVKLNTVLIGGFNDNEIPALVDLTRERPLDVRFIEMMPMGGVFDKSAYISGQTVLDSVPELAPVKTDENGVARLYALPGAQGRVGIISPISSHFCGSCNRLRLTSEGAIKPCLHSSEEIRVRGLHGEELRDALRYAISRKPEKHGLLDASHSSEAGRNMNTIGG